MDKVKLIYPTSQSLLWSHLLKQKCDNNEYIDNGGEVTHSNVSTSSTPAPSKYNNLQYLFLTPSLLTLTNSATASTTFKIFDNKRKLTKMWIFDSKSETLATIGLLFIMARLVIT